MNTKKFLKEYQNCIICGGNLERKWGALVCNRSNNKPDPDHGYVIYTSYHDYGANNINDRNRKTIGVSIEKIKYNNKNFLISIRFLEKNILIDVALNNNNSVFIGLKDFWGIQESIKNLDNWLDYNKVKEKVKAIDLLR